MRELVGVRWTMRELVETLRAHWNTVEGELVDNPSVGGQSGCRWAIRVSVGDPVLVDDPSVGGQRLRGGGEEETEVGERALVGDPVLVDDPGVGERFERRCAM